MTDFDLIVSLTETTVEKVMDFYAAGLIHTLDTPLHVAYAEAPYGDVETFLQSFIDYHSDMLDSYIALKQYYDQQRAFADVAPAMVIANRIEEKLDSMLDQNPETD